MEEKKYFTVLNLTKAQLSNLNPHNGFLFAYVQREMNEISPLLYFLLSAAGAFRKNVTKAIHWVCLVSMFALILRRTSV